MKHPQRMESVQHRRTVLKTVGAAGLFATVPWTTGRVTAVTGSSDLEFTGHKFTDELPRPAVLSPSGRNGRALHYDIELSEFRQQVLPEAMYEDLDISGTKVWGYGGSFPGPTIEAEPRQPVEVKYIIDELPETHLLDVDTNVHGAGSSPEVRISTHLHGGVVKPEDDGYPEVWASPDGTTNNQPIAYKQTKEYPNEQKPGTMWYHDHALGITRLNVYAGLAGFYLLRDPLESRLPNADYEIPIVIQDRTFDEAGELDYPDGDPPYEAEFAADIPVVNGKAYPKLTVEPRKYRLRFLNGSNGRTFNLRLYNEDDSSEQDVPLFQQIGVDLGFLEEVVNVGPGGTTGPEGIIDSLLLSGAERADLIVDFSGYEGESFLVKNDAEFPYAGENSGPDIGAIGEIMRIEVGTTVSSEDDETMPLEEFLNAINRKHPEPNVTDSGITRTHTLASSVLDPEGIAYDTHFLNLSFWEDGVMGVTPELGTSETWEFVNLTGDSHPIHIHLVDFDVIERESFEWGGTEGGEGDYNDAAEKYVNDPENEERPDYTNYVTFPGTIIQPNPNNATHKDTVLVNPTEIVRVKPAFTGYSGLYPWHCHILEHEDQEMMLPFEVVES